MTQSLLPTVVFREHRPGWLLVSFPPQLSHIRELPGVQKHGALFKVPMDLVPFIAGICDEQSIEVALPREHFQDEQWRINPTLFPYQNTDVKRIIEMGHYLLNYETGCGKTAPPIEVARLTNLETMLIVCPAMVREHWQDELDKWWPGHPEGSLLETGKKLPDTPIVSTSYELAKHLNPKARWGMVVIDEAHMIKEAGTQRSRVLRKIASYNDQAFIIGLTATPMTTEPKDLHHQLDSIWPGAFGSWYNFTRAYCNIEETRFGSNVNGLNEDRAYELRSRLSTISSRVTKAEIAHLLPPFQVEAVRIPSQRAFNVREILEDLSSAERKQHEKRLDGLILRATGAKLKRCVEMATTRATGGDRVAILTHFRASVVNVAGKLRRLEPVCIDGSIPVKKRLGMIRDAIASGRPLIATLHSINVGIDLTAYNVALFLELPWSPKDLLQALGRFSRLSGKVPSTSYLLLLEGSLDEIVADTVFKRLRDQGQLLHQTESERQVTEQFDPDNISDEEMMEQLIAVAAQRVERDEYL